MQEEIYSLQNILDTFSKTTKNRAKKRVIFDQSPIGGIGRKWVIAFFISLPIMLYIGIFNPVVFAMLGIAQAIIFFIVFLSMVMIMIIALTFINNNKVIRQIEPSWKHLFPEEKLQLVLSSGVTPYKDFFQYYTQGVQAGEKGDVLYQSLKRAFIKMKEENKDLLEAMSPQIRR